MRRRTLAVALLMLLSCFFTVVLAAPSASAQNVPPTCSIRSPIPGAWIGGDYPVWGMANDTDGTLVSVEIRIDEGPWFEANWSEVNGTRFWILEWDTTEVQEGDHAIYARSYDGEDYSETAQVNVWVEQVHGDTVHTILGLPGWLWIVIVSVVIVVITAVLLLLLARKRKRGQSGDQTPET